MTLWFLLFGTSPLYNEEKGGVKMKKIGKEVLFLSTSEHNQRNGEGTFLRLKDGGILFAFTQYYGDHWDDHVIARIAACVSYDEGETFSEPFTLLEKDEKAQNIMSACLMRMANGDLGLFYLRKEVMEDNGIACMPYLRRSTDEGKTFGEPIRCTDTLGYYCPQNDAVRRLKSGRLVFPMSFNGERHDAFGNCTLDKSRLTGGMRSYICVMYSDDDGYTWNRMGAELYSPYADPHGFAEPGIYEHENGDLWLVFRSGYGFQYQSYSSDEGKTWSDPIPNFCFTSPDAPLHMRRVGDRLMAAFNPYSYNCLRTAVEAWNSPKRTPLVVATCKRDGRSFDTRGKLAVNEVMYEVIDNSYLIEDDESNSYCYPCLFETKDGFLAAYYHSNGTPVCLNCTKITKVYWDELN